MNSITVIVPMYNEENNVEQCVVTLKNQTDQNFNVVFIDDGSTDDTLTRLEIQLHNGVEFKYQIISQTNKGAAEARKIGINKSETEYIMFYDCDDVISDNMINAFYQSQDKYKDADIILPKMLFQKKNQDWQEIEIFSENEILHPIDCVKHSLDGWKIHGCFAIKKNIILKSYKDYESYNLHNHNYMNNDEVITRLNYFNSKLIIQTPAVYYYCYNSSSTNHRLNNKRYLTIKNAIILKHVFSSNPDLYKEVNSELLIVIWANLRYLRENMIRIDNKQKWYQEIKLAVKEFDYFDLISQIRPKRKIQLTLLKLLFSI